MDSPTLANAPRSLSPGESIGATEFYEGARMVESGFEPLEVTARERSIARRERRERLGLSSGEAARRASTPECLPPGSNPGRRGAPADPCEAFGFAQSRETPRRLSTVPRAVVRRERSDCLVQSNGERSEPRDEASGTSGDEQRESPGARAVSDGAQSRRVTPSLAMLVQSWTRQPSRTPLGVRSVPASTRAERAWARETDEVSRPASPPRPVFFPGTVE